MAANEILLFAHDPAANVQTQAEYLADAQREIGHQPGIAKAELENKALRQASLIASGVAQFLADLQATDIEDTLTPANISTIMQAVVAALIQAASYKDLASLTATVAANALTGTLSAETLDFRDPVVSSGARVTRVAAAPVALVVPSGATLGTAANVAARIVWGWIDNAGTLEPFVCNLSGGLNLDETTLISTTAISAAADSANVFYSTVARANVTFRVRGFCDITEAVAGTWATAPTLVQPAGGLAANSITGFGVGQTPQDMTASRASGVTYTNTTGKPIQVIVGSSLNNGNIGVVVAGMAYPAFTVYSSQSVCFVVPPGASYSVTLSNLTKWVELR